MLGKHLCFVSEGSECWSFPANSSLRVTPAGAGGGGVPREKQAPFSRHLGWADGWGWFAGRVEGVTGILGICSLWVKKYQQRSWKIIYLFVYPLTTGASHMISQRKKTEQPRNETGWEGEKKTQTQWTKGQSKQTDRQHLILTSSRFVCFVIALKGGILAQFCLHQV